MATETHELNPIGQQRVVSVALEQDDSSTHAPTVIVRAQFGDAFFEVGRQTFAAPSGAPGSGRRVVALVDIAGSKVYQVETDGDAKIKMQADRTSVYIMQPINWLTYGPSPVLPSQPDSYVWVATNGDDTTGQIGRIDRPYQTIQAAVNAASFGPHSAYSILIAPGNYNGANIPQNPPKNYAFVAQGEGVQVFGRFTATADPGTADLVEWIYFRNIRAFFEVGGAFVFDGSPAGAASTWMRQGVFFDRCGWGALSSQGLICTKTGPVVALNCRGENCSVELNSIASGWFEGYRGDTVANGSNLFIINYDPNSETADGRGPIYLINSTAVGAFLFGCPWVEYRGFNGSSFDLGTVYNFFNGIRDYAPRVRGSIRGVELQHTIPAPITAVVPDFDFSECNILNLCGFTSPAAQRGRVRNSVLQSLIPGEVYAQDNAITDIRGSVFNQQALASFGAGTPAIDRDYHVIDATSDDGAGGGGGAIVPFSPAFSTSNYSVLGDFEPAGVGTPNAGSYDNKNTNFFQQYCSFNGLRVRYTVQMDQEAL
jgi:hypothetical protein